MVAACNSMLHVRKRKFQDMSEQHRVLNAQKYPSVLRENGATKVDDCACEKGYFRSTGESVKQNVNYVPTPFQTALQLRWGHFQCRLAY